MEWCVRIAVKWHRSSWSEAEPYVMEVVTPRTNAAALSSAENFFASIALAEPVSVEMAADCNSRRFLVRTSTPHMRQQLLSQLSAAYPQADLRAVPPDDDPAILRDGEQEAACTLSLRAPAYLPLRTFTDLDVDGDRAAQADPVLGILSALGDLPAGWRGLSQVVLLPAPEDWCRDYQRLSVQHPLEHERMPRPSESAVPTLAFVAMLLGLFIVGAQAYAFYRAAEWLQLFGLAMAALFGLGGLILVTQRLSRAQLYDMDLVREKVTRIACRAEVRVAVYAPAGIQPERMKRQLERIAAVYRRFNLAAANGFVARPAIKVDRFPWRYQLTSCVDICCWWPRHVAESQH
jgi:hypothetical protein